MIRNRITVGLLFTMACLAFAAGSLSVDALLKDSKKFDKKVVTVNGSVQKFEAKTSKRGNKYTVFKLKGSTAKSIINVYLKGHLTKPVKNGDSVSVTGKWQVEKKMGTTVFKNEIDASTSKPGAPQQVKLLKKAAK